MKVRLDNWRQGLRDAAKRIGLPRFWRWWIGELVPLLPSASRIAFQRRFVRPVIEFANGEAVFWRPDQLRDIVKEGGRRSRRRYPGPKGREGGS